MTISRMRSAALVGFLLLGAVGTAQAARFDIAPDAAGNLVSFKSHATMESFEGKTTRVQGYVDVDPGALGDSVTVHVEVDMASLDTGIDMRNRHMRENHLETDRYPTAVFEGGRVIDASARSLVPGQKVTFNLSGRFDLHGVRRTITVPVEVTREETGGTVSLQVSTSFPVNLSDYGISRPKFLLLRLADEQAVSIRLTAVSKP